MVLEGARLVADALERGFRPRVLAVSESFLAARRAAVEPDVVLSDTLFDALCDTETPQGILAVFDMPWAALGRVIGCDRIVALDGLQDPGNVGTIVRTAEAFAFDGVLVLPGTANPFSPKAVRASMGSCLGVAIARAEPADLRKIPHTIVALSPDGPEELHPALVSGRIAVCLGQESGGLRGELREITHHLVRIPMRGRTESLNVAVAAGIVMACAAGVPGGCG